MRRFFFVIVIGVIGTAILVSLGNWQVRRLAWKEAVLADIDARIAAAPVAVPNQPDPERDAYLPVMATGSFVGDPIHVLVSHKRLGAGYRVISAFETDERRILVDRGFQRVDQKGPAVVTQMVTVTGNLHWPDEIDRYTPDPDPDAGLWFARNVGPLAETLDTQPILIIAREITENDASLTPLPIDSSGIPNDHLEYVITWYGFAVIWVLMTLLFLWQARQKTSGRKPKDARL